MVELLFVACIGMHCAFETVPVSYPNHDRCAMAAAVTAGRLRGRMDPQDPVFYRFKCTSAGGGGLWYAMIDGTPAVIGPEITVRSMP